MAKSKVNQEALDYHEHGRPGKIEVVPTKPYSSQRDLSLAYSPGVAEPCLRIAENPDDVYRYTAKGNLVAVISNGTAVLGLGNIGPEASKPVMEGKGLLFKIFADIDVFDIEINETDVEKFVQTVKAISPTFGGINLEDIKAPECFEIERRLKEELRIPVMHDDQHGTAIISAAALLNALELAKKKIDKVVIVVSGAGASAISCAKLYLSLGAKKENIIMLDSTGVLHESRKDLDANKIFFATKRNVHTLVESMKGADVFVGLSKGNIVSAEMVKSMAKNAIVFALANPDPEITYEEASAARPDIILATGRSDYPNQVNNVLGFPFIFRGALDVRATQINEAMKLAAVRAIADLAKEPVPEIVNIAYNKKNITFGMEYIIPKPLDPRLITTVAPAVAKAAIDSGVAQSPITNWSNYSDELSKRLGLDNKLIRVITSRAKQNPQRIVFAEADTYKILKAAQIVRDEGIAKPILLGNLGKIRQLIEENNLDLGDTPIIDPRLEEDKRHEFGEIFFKKRKRRGFTLYEAKKIMNERNYYGAMMVEVGEADAMISGLTRKYSDTIRPALQIIGTQDDVKKVAGMYIMVTKKGPVFFADTTLNVNPTAEELAEITVLTAWAVQQFNIKPRIALLSYSNFGSTDDPMAKKVRDAVAILHQKFPGMMVDGEMQANFALNPHLLSDNFPFCEFAGEGANTLIFPTLEAGNIAYKLLQEMGGAEAIGPVLLGMKKPVHILQLGSSVREIVNMVTIAVVDAVSRKSAR
ncbi:MAG: NADP-dependent malic enzyme [Bacteroidetes bacterium]|nr:NADP-dependent malic enzyme [Bacteroidota bacterium]MBP6401928.1 NADP-dependent malic enzyme [Bacteroidia bacterium]MBP6648581.1 NADP-dependent malic enzyme [Bacteroidia bacterium]